MSPEVSRMMRDSMLCIRVNGGREMIAQRADGRLIVLAERIAAYPPSAQTKALRLIAEARELIAA